MINLLSSDTAQYIGKSVVASSFFLWLYDFMGSYVPPLLHVLMSLGAAIFLYYSILRIRESWKGTKLDNKLKARELNEDKDEDDDTGSPS